MGICYTVIISTYFRKITFPHKGVITIINQLSFFAFISQLTGSILLVYTPQLALQNIGVGLLKDSSLMGTFALLLPATSEKIANIETCYMISSTPFGLRKITGDFEVFTLDEYLPPNPIELA